jgi:hypothetical protein
LEREENIFGVLVISLEREKLILRSIMFRRENSTETDVSEGHP